MLDQPIKLAGGGGVMIRQVCNIKPENVATVRSRELHTGEA